MKEIISYGRFHCAELLPHKNQGMEITYIDKGMMEWMVEGKPEKVEGGTVFFTLPWQVHGSLHPNEPDNTLWHVLFHLENDYPTPRDTFRFPKTFGFSPAEMKILSTAFASSNRHCLRATPAMRELMPSLVGELQSTHELRDAQAITLLRAVIVELKRIISGDAVDAETHTTSERRVQSLIDSLSSSIDQQWTLESMAGQCGIKRTQLNKVFQKLTGGTPMEYLWRIRMERAKTLLRETDVKIIDIAFECGYGSSQYFSNSFKQATGATPSAYRKRCSGLSPAESRNWKNIQFRSEEEERLRAKVFSIEKK
ncbi:AraC family transcriptional regulator [Pontiella sulfatireligans]|uniref:HTH-type transcriptional activator RhaS n=1 Tax=Pontiella sulfatireligans TaxID=2750658 RepID=A0A6C2UW24_9BACT|nr:AraC family transcriptional regulator [Pontiella sulfatireligans]VGO23036.1 HTH-type transcriptional activator RhaS [Pontiella sulfatireligans]